MTDTVTKVMAEEPNIEKWLPNLLYTNNTEWCNIDKLDKVDIRYCIYIDAHKCKEWEGSLPVARINYKDNKIKTLNLNYGPSKHPPKAISSFLRAIEFMKFAQNKDFPVLIVDCNDDHKQRGYSIFAAYLMDKKNYNFYRLNKKCRKIRKLNLDAYYKNQLAQLHSILKRRKRKTISSCQLIMRRLWKSSSKDFRTIECETIDENS